MIILPAATIARFWRYVAIGAADECWPWRGYAHRGYGQFSIGGRIKRAHRVAYLIANGQWPEPQGRHTCDNRPCCNPSHILAGTNAENVADMVSRGRSPRSQGEKHGRAVLTEADVRRIRILRESGRTLHEIAAMFGMSHQGIGHVCSGRRWSHLPLKEPA